ncbi:twin-arginine translocase TatA/TatE family subunit [Ferrimicrobium sp.]|uniref:Sec-independent protein translocase subunit TatA/TatB n=1 Tax=Ferrimicrobium sp. TaxID=2926050 RepID=UPI00261212D7|nr:twin-arginine translocase TatA/TatE family subunit [Ferrimicrobium sp.]
MEIDPIKLAFVAIAALVLLGPERLPQLAKKAGELLATLRNHREALTNQINSVTNLPNSAVGGFLGETLKTAGTVTSMFQPTGMVGSVLQPARMVNSMFQPSTQAPHTPTRVSRTLQDPSSSDGQADANAARSLAPNPGYTLGSPDLN